jgi:hypothetical protein
MILLFPITYPFNFKSSKSIFLNVENDINLNPKKYAFMVYYGIILIFIVFKEGKTPNLRKTKA